MITLTFERRWKCQATIQFGKISLLFTIFFLQRFKFEITIGFIFHYLVSIVFRFSFGFCFLDLGLKLFLTMQKHIITMLIFWKTLEETRKLYFTTKLPWSEFTLEKLSKARWRRQPGRQQTNGLMRKILAVHLPYKCKSLHISYPSSSKQQRARPISA